MKFGISLLMVNGCAKHDDVSCQVFDYIKVSKQDTQETARQVLLHNRKLQALCE